MRIVELTDESKNNILENLLKRSPNSYGKFESAVAEILLNIKTRGDEALFEERLSLIFVLSMRSRNSTAGLILSRMELY